MAAAFTIPIPLSALKHRNRIRQASSIPVCVHTPDKQRVTPFVAVPPRRLRPPSLIRYKFLSPNLNNSNNECQLEQAYDLASSRGALGRGVRACMRAFYRRASFILASARISEGPLYVEIGPAYVLATARMGKGGERITRYAVERRAWPALQKLFKWEETSTMEARDRGAILRYLGDARRFGRHLFIQYDALATIVQVAEELVEVVEERTERGLQGHELYRGLGEGKSGSVEWRGNYVEAVVELKKRPLPGKRTVAARCPRGVAHSNMDRNPSLILWMNSDGITGGAMCPVCVEKGRTGDGTSRNMTWRVHYLPDPTAVLCTPHRRIRSPERVERALEEYRRRSIEAAIVVVGQSEKKMHLASDCLIPASTLGLVAQGGESRDKEIAMAKQSEERIKPATTDRAIGGCVMVDKNRIARVGGVIGMAYVTASLRIGMDASAAGEIKWEGSRQRTVGTMAKQACPMQVLLWSERRSKGPMVSRRVEEVAWFARRSVNLAGDGGLNADCGFVDEVVESEEWLPMPLVSVSAMRPASWKDVTAANGRLISVPASWEASAQAWVLFDIDDIDLVCEAIIAEAGNKISLVVRREQELSGRCLVVRTGPSGIHVWAELREVREDPGTWFKMKETRAWYRKVGDRLLNATHRAGALGGTVDMSSCAAGRFARRPGWRLLEDGTQFRAHVVTYVPSRVRSRGARIPNVSRSTGKRSTY